MTAKRDTISSMGVSHYMISLSVTSGQWFSPDTLVSSTNKTDIHDIIEILLKVALNTITLPLTLILRYSKLNHDDVSSLPEDIR